MENMELVKLTPDKVTLLICSLSSDVMCALQSVNDSDDDWTLLCCRDDDIHQT